MINTTNQSTQAECILAPLSPLVLGAVVARATTGQFNLGAFLLVLGVGELLLLALMRWRAELSLTGGTLLGLLAWGIQTSGRVPLFHVGWSPIWALLPLLLLGIVAVSDKRVVVALIPAAYAAIALSALWGGAPIWTLSALLPAPLAWPYIRNACAGSECGMPIPRLTLLTALFMTVGYLIVGIVR